MSDLIVMTKGDATAEVHRTCVADHVRCGWVVSVADAAQPDALVQPKTKTPRAAKPAQTEITQE